MGLFFFVIFIVMAAECKKDFNSLLNKGLQGLEHERGTVEWISHPDVNSMINTTSGILKCGSDVVTELAGSAGQIATQEWFWKEFGRPIFPTCNHSNTFTTPGGSKTGPNDFFKSTVKMCYKKMRIWFMKIGLLSTSDLEEQSSAYRKSVTRSKSKNPPPTSPAEMDMESMIENEMKQLEEEYKAIPSLNVQRAKFVFGALVTHGGTGGFMITGQNERMLFEQIAVMFGGPGWIGYTEMSEFQKKFTGGKSDAATILALLGDQTSPQKDHTSQSYSIGEVKVQRSMVVTNGTIGNLRWLLSTIGTGAIERGNVLISAPFVEHPRAQCKDIFRNVTKSQMMEQWSDLFAIIGIISLTTPESGFEKWRDLCPVMTFTPSPLNGPDGKPINELDLNALYPGYKMISHNGTQIPALPPARTEAVDEWAIVKLMQTSYLSTSLEYTTLGVDPSIIMSHELYHLNDRECRKVNNKALVFSLMYNIFNWGWRNIRTATADVYTAVRQMVDPINNNRNSLNLFNKAAYHDVLLFHQYMKKTMIVYKQTCSKNNIPIHDKVSKISTGLLTAPNPTNTKNVMKTIPDDVLFFSFAFAKKPNHGEPTEMNTKKLRSHIRQIMKTGEVSAYFQQQLVRVEELSMVSIDKANRWIWKWSFKAFEPIHDNPEVVDLLRLIFIETDYTTYQTRYKNLKTHKPSLKDYYLNVCQGNEGCWLSKMEYGKFEQFIKGEISWESASVGL
eukprot:300519_1